ncbi:MAG TPA: hypothetical protein VHS97_22560 [Isosphaeraceae bacterium]|nr:hypothetical protein [Isosphaeraceae bacterium]
MRSKSFVLTSPGFRTGLAGGLAVVLILVAWLWPIGIGGKMPVGGDVTQFFIGLMGFLSESLRQGRLPVWNDLWGFGFPGVAESQMGVFYPVHVILYRWLETETAYVVSLVAHTLWGGLGTYWAARRLKVSCTGAALAAGSWSTCGFFVIHLAHPWGYTTGCWMPWAWGLAWCSLAPASAFQKIAPLLLSLVLVLQVLPGHFQLAFLTQFGILLFVLWMVTEHWVGRARAAPTTPRDTAVTNLRGLGRVFLAMAAVFPLAAVQLWPTARLAGLAASQRDFEYMSGFASTPFHLVNYVAPGLFHRSPLWRPLVWTPFHTAPEEHLAYIGLVPLFLAVMAMVREWRNDRTVRLLAILFFVTLCLSLGPYLPGFRQTIMVPGFSFFRAPSRWSLASALALAILAGKGFDRWLEWPSAGRSLQRLNFLAFFWVLATVGIIELALASTRPPGWPAVARGFQRVFDAMPWNGDPTIANRDTTFAAVMAGAREQPDLPVVPVGLSRAMFLQENKSDGSFASERVMIYSRELVELAALLIALWFIARLSERDMTGRARSRWALVALAFVDLWVLGRHRLVDLGPLKPLAEQSPVLARLTREPRGTRIADDKLKNLPMLVGLAPLAAYRTLDLPAIPELTSLTRAPTTAPAIAPYVTAAFRATGTGLRVFDPIENRREQLLGRGSIAKERIDDPALATWLFGATWVADHPWARAFSIWRAENPPVRAWLVPLDSIDSPVRLEESSGDPREILKIIDSAAPLESESARPDELAISVKTDDPAWVIVSQLADPQWTALWVGLDEQGKLAGEILPAFRRGTHPGGWQRIAVPGSGRWTLRLKYDARDVADGAVVSTIAWLCWLMAAFWMTIQYGRGGRSPGRNQTEA